MPAGIHPAMSTLLLVAGFVPLIYGASLLVDGGSALAKRLNVPAIVIGLTIVAFGTSAPELVVNVLASIEGTSSIALGNVLGSNIFNVLVVLGVSAVFVPLAVKHGTTWSEIPLAILAATTAFVLANDAWIDGRSFSEISRIDGIILLSFFLIFMAYNIHLSRSEDFQEDVEIPDFSLGKCALFIGIGLALLILGGKLIVDGAVGTARMFGISERVIALTIVAMGTSLPELVTSVVAARKKNVDIAIGNVVGSNIFNIFLVLGVSGVIRPVPLVPGASFDLTVAVGVSVLLFTFVFTGRGRQIERWEGLVMLAAYAGYLGALLLGVGQ